jgi:glycosyltransferase involved in cell wall biosynthesis
MKKPTFSIITITFNAEKYLERTLKSIQAQDCKDFEYLLIDGNSKDKTLAIAKNYQNLFTKIISEPDKGLYDAMNKGLKNAQGEFVWFINAGDEIADNEAISKIKNLIDEATDVLYGETYFVNNNGEILGLRSELTPHRLPEKLHWQQMKYGMLVCHQSFIARRTIAPFFDISNLSADLDWEIQCLKNARKTVFLDFIVSKYLIGGISNQQLKRSLIDRFKVLSKHFGLFSCLIAHLIIVFRGIRKIIRQGGKYW